MFFVKIEFFWKASNLGFDKSFKNMTRSDLG